MKARLFDAAVDLGIRRYGTAAGCRPHLALADPVLERPVRAKVQARFGGRLKAMVSGGAPLNPEVGLFFVALGLPLLQGYGQTEAAPVISVNPPRRQRSRPSGRRSTAWRLKIADGRRDPGPRRAW